MRVVQELMGQENPYFSSWSKSGYSKIGNARLQEVISRGLRALLARYTGICWETLISAIRFLSNDILTLVNIGKSMALAMEKSAKLNKGANLPEKEILTATTWLHPFNFNTQRHKLHHTPLIPSSFCPHALRAKMTTLLHTPTDLPAMPFDTQLVRRKSSAVSTSSTATNCSARRASIVSLSLMNHSRQPLAPLGPQMTPAYAFANTPSTCDPPADGKRRSRQSLSEESQLKPGAALDSSNQAPRRASGSTDGRLISTPARLQAAYSARRGSLPILSIPNQVASLPNSVPSPSMPLKPPGDNGLFNQLQSYVLSSSKRPKEDNSRIQTPPSPKASLITRKGRRPEVEEMRKETRDSSDEEEIARQLERAKLRAIDDGSRRPSLPINIPPSQNSVSVERKNEIAATLAAAPKTLPEVPSSDPGPSNALANFDLDFIFGERAYPNGPLAIPSGASAYGGARRMSVSLDTGTDAQGWTDTFERFVNQHIGLERATTPTVQIIRRHHHLHHAQRKHPWLSVDFPLSTGRPQYLALHRLLRKGHQVKCGFTSTSIHVLPLIHSSLGLGIHRELPNLPFYSLPRRSTSTFRPRRARRGKR
ncbi:uncharacterized protein EI90DRAFT_715233 [Cantharellus anzutake]|uniref:uncharacterized protein n=1 Tax=Cantharellus anzutake TaxID=1750568 RepID=UPI001903784B|nr:uncharacterized protein EI90DRAFT_715233 [Cantharellus anzutake]KAF8332853.1 hypothetical protein EI90DRAFT_715233 [Cantharellus anzutake]